MTGWSAIDSARMLARRYHDDRCQKRLAAASASDLRRLESVLVGGPGRDGGGSRPVGLDVGAIERLGVRPECLRAEAERLALVRRQPVRRAIPGEDRQDRDCLTQLAQAGDEAAAGEGDVVRMRRDEDVGHGRPSIPSGTGRPPLRWTPSPRPAEPDARPRRASRGSCSVARPRRRWRPGRRSPGPGPR